MNDARLRRILRSALAVTLASPAVVAAASCGGSVESESSGSNSSSGSTSGGSGTTPTSNPPDKPPPLPPLPPLPEDAGSCGNAELPPSDACMANIQLPCSLLPDAGWVPSQDCDKICPKSAFVTGPATQCAVTNNAQSEPYVMCVYCAPVGRRPDGLEAVAPASGTTLGAYFANVSRLEAASVDAFVALGDELSTCGAPRDLIARAARSARDEVRHARVTASLADRFGVEPGAWNDPPRVARAANRTLEGLARENAVEGCVRETFGALVALWQAEHATDAGVRFAMRGIAKDESRHAALAWSVAEWAAPLLDGKTRASLHDAMRAAIAELEAEVAQQPDVELIARAGIPNASDAKRLLAALADQLWSRSLAA